MRRLIFAAAVMVAAATPAHAEWRVVRWIGPQRCEVLNHRPPFGRWEELAAYRTRREAERGLDAAIRQRQCRASKLAALRPEPRPER